MKVCKNHKLKTKKFGKNQNEKEKILKISKNKKIEEFKKIAKNIWKKQKIENEKNEKILKIETKIF